MTRSESNRNYQETLAETLLRQLGMDAAIDACARNCWDGVLAILLKRRDHVAA